MGVRDPTGHPSITGDNGTPINARRQWDTHQLPRHDLQARTSMGVPAFVSSPLSFRPRFRSSSPLDAEEAFMDVPVTPLPVTPLPVPSLPVTSHRSTELGRLKRLKKAQIASLASSS